MLGVHINPMLDFRKHFLYITKDVDKIAKTIAKRNLSPPLKSIAIEQLLKSKYRTVTPHRGNDVLSASFL